VFERLFTVELAGDLALLLRGQYRSPPLARGSDALHLAAVFGISERAAIRDANSAKAFLESSLEQNQ
jgi:hypothetical protein